MIVIIGAGIAGMVAALALAPRPVLLIARAGPGGESSTALAQGGIAAALGKGDSLALHLADTLAAGDGLCDADAARLILSGGADAIAMLERHGVRFDRDGDGFALGLEAAHSRRRILHTRDGSGAEIARALSVAVGNCPSVTQLRADVRRVLTAEGRAAGVMLADGTVIPAGAVILATGGLGGLYAETTNPPGNWGQGVAMALHAGAAVADMEFVQFHPTALNIASDPLPLISEAVRGEGAHLVDAAGQRILADDLAPRDIVSRALNGRQAFLDARRIAGFADRFPGIAARCRQAGLDPARDPIPVRPAAHYHMGGVATDACGRTTLPGLWAIGECAATGMHGANRLASNSLLEAAVTAIRAAFAMETGTMAEVRAVDLPPVGDIRAVRRVTSQRLGILRDGPSLRGAIATLLPLVQAGSDPALVSLSIATFAHLRSESCGAHCRTDDAPQRQPLRRRMGLDELLQHAREGAAIPEYLN